MKLRPYQSDAVSSTLDYFESKKGMSPIIEMPTGSGKAIVVPGVIYGAMYKYNTKLRAIVVVPSKELCIQNTEKLRLMAPPGVSVGMYSASVGEKDTSSDIICATIKSIKDKSSELGHRHILAFDECHLVNPDGKGDYWKLIDGMSNNGPFKQFGLTATPYRGNGVWLTEGSRPAFHGFSYKIGMVELMNSGYLSPLVVPKEKIKTRIDVSGIKMSGYDYNVKDLSERTSKYLICCAEESIAICRSYSRNKWMAFLPDIETATDFNKIMNSMGVPSAIITGDTPKDEREYMIDNYRKGYLTCLITVVALVTGFDVPDIDALIWMRTTVSPILYKQGAGRGTRLSQSKVNCLWLDFTDTTERMGPLNEITGRGKKKNRSSDAPCIICDNCGNSIRPASTIWCPECGYQMRDVEEVDARGVSMAEIITENNMEPTLPITRIECRPMKTEKGKNYIYIYFYNGVIEICREPIFFSGISIAPSCCEFWLSLTGDYAGNHNSYTSCFNYLVNAIKYNPSLGISRVKIQRASKQRRFDKLLEIIR
ncbi:putative nuclease [Dickeya phage Sucellus]|nr:putative nuclease [Dickeya phage Sucellus]